MLLLLFLFLIMNSVFKQYSLVSMDKYHGEFQEMYGCTLEDFLKTKQFQTYEFTGDELQDNQIIKNYRAALVTMIKSKDSLMGIHVKFNNKTTYENFIRVFDYCYIENAKVYIYNKDDLWITNPATKAFKEKYPLQKHYNWSSSDIHH